jgi:hypothetical protein
VTHPYLRAIGLVLTLCLLGSPIAGAQSSWTVTVTPTMNPLPVATCGAVWLKVLDPLTRDTPRSPSGALVTIADFDMTVSTPDGKSVVGQYTDASHWSACACQGATVGTVATITATYPAQALSSQARVPGVAFQTTVDFSLALAKSGWNPPGCPAPPAAVIAVAGTPTTALQSPPSTTTVAQTAGPVAAQQSIPVPIAAGNPRSAPPVGPPPAGVTVTGTPALARVTWGFVGASSYSVERWMQNDPSCCRASSPQLGARETGWDDPLPLSGTYVYRVTASYADGRQGFVDVTYLRPEPTNPAILTGIRQRVFWQQQQGLTPGYWQVIVRVDWSEVPGAAYYVLWGPGQPTTGTRLNTTVSNNVETHQTSVLIRSDAQPAGAPKLTWGLNSWTVGAFFLPGPISTVGRSFTRGTLDLQPCTTGAVWC